MEQVANSRKINHLNIHAFANECQNQHYINIYTDVFPLAGCKVRSKTFLSLTDREILIHNKFLF